jgi:hypothetical protein
MQDFAAHPGHLASNTMLYEGRYRVDLLLAETPLMAIYRGWDLAQQRPATILEMATPDPASAAAALEHAVPLIQLDHALLTPIQVLFVENNTFFVTLALAGGQTLEHIMVGRAAPISPAAAVRWVAQVGEGIEFLAHELPSWHLGDLTPASLLVTAGDRVQILNFAIALGLLKPQTVAAVLPAGSIAPELAEGRCDARSDVYSLAATLNFLLTCRRWQVTGAPSPDALVAQRPELSPAFAAAVMRGLALAPEDRWPDAATFYQELLRTLPGAHAIDNAALLWGLSGSQLDELADEPPTLVTTRDQLQAAMDVERARREQESARTESVEETPSPSSTPAIGPVDTYVVLSSDAPPAGQEPSSAIMASAPDAIPDTVPQPDVVPPTVMRTRIYDLPAARDALFAATFAPLASEQSAESTPLVANPSGVQDDVPAFQREPTLDETIIRQAGLSPEPDVSPQSEVAAESAEVRDRATAPPPVAPATEDAADLVVSPTLPRQPREEVPAEPMQADEAQPSEPKDDAPVWPSDEQLIVAHSQRQPTEPSQDSSNDAQTNDQGMAGRAMGGIAVGGLLDRLRTLLHVPGPMPSLATGTVVVPRHMYPQHTYSILVRLQSRGMPEPPKKAAFVLVEIDAAPEAFYVPVKRLALRLPVEGGLSEGSIAVTAQRPSPVSTDLLTFSFRSSDGAILHEGQFLAEVAILAPQQLASGTPMLTLVHALDIERMIS